MLVEDRDLFYISAARSANGLTEWKMSSGTTLQEYESGEKS